MGSRMSDKISEYLAINMFAFLIELLKMFHVKKIRKIINSLNPSGKHIYHLI